MFMFDLYEFSEEFDGWMIWVLQFYNLLNWLNEEGLGCTVCIQTCIFARNI